MILIREILKKYPEASYWHQQYPWFAVGQLVNNFNQKDTPSFETTAQKTAVYFNDVLRLHWLLHPSETTTADLEITPQENHTATTPLAVAAAHIYTEPSFKIDLSASEDENEENEEMIEEDNEAPAMPVKSLSASLADLANSFKNASTSEEDTLAYQTAYQHTIDYFASQGIKLDAEPAKDDRLGQQLKTFTSWLRQMKPLANTEGSEADPVVELNAAHSLLGSDVVTEAMVDILQKQGKKTQAVQLLEKLLLLHPEKSLYFAARIEQIKTLK